MTSLLSGNVLKEGEAVSKRLPPCSRPGGGEGGLLPWASGTKLPGWGRPRPTPGGALRPDTASGGHRSVTRFSHRPPRGRGWPLPGQHCPGKAPPHSVGGFWAQAWQRGPRPPLLTLVQGFVLTCLRQFKTFPDHPAHTRVHLKTYAQSTEVS